MIPTRDTHRHRGRSRPGEGGVVWEALGSRYNFLIGVVIVLLSAIAARGMRTERVSSAGPAAAEG